MFIKLFMPKFWHKKNFISYFLYPIALLFNIISSVLRFVPKSRIYYPKAKIISVGNVTMGGAGKTPLALSIASFFKHNTKKKFAILSRGYLGSLKGPVLVDNHHFNEVGDEALLLSRHFTTCVAKDRLAGIHFLEEKGYEIIITDDGLQDERFIKALNILVIDSSFGFGNGFVFPAGPLRESLSSVLKRIDFIVLIGNNDFKIDCHIPILKATIQSEVSLEKEQFIAFAGIGNPDKFFNSVISSNGIIIDKYRFQDHHQYSLLEIENLINLAKTKQAKLITTEKDYVRINDNFKEQIKVLPIKLIWQDENELTERLKKI